MLHFHYLYSTVDTKIFKPKQWVAKGIMFFTHPYVSPSLSMSVRQSCFFFISTTPLEPLNRISWNFVIMKNVLSKCAYLQVILIQFFSGNYNASFKLRNLAKIKYTTKTVCQHNSSDTAQQNFWAYFEHMHVHRKF